MMFPPDVENECWPGSPGGDRFCHSVAARIANLGSRPATGGNRLNHHPCQTKSPTSASRWGFRFFWRRGPESNRAGRICNPVHNRFATAPACCEYRAKTGRHEATVEFTREKGKPFWASLRSLERDKRLELSTYTLARYRSTN